ncbi:hypothetical protein ASZ90_018285 [hydrocarbon metagenome]|uniref:Uncharacterized protein n=1 Tax=hydrocarbon metagenome TaxID=938273 RepID=A0A0W8E7A9_9ZZZZ
MQGTGHKAVKELLDLDIGVYHLYAEGDNMVTANILTACNKTGMGSV